MFTSYLTSAVRALLRDGFHAALNIAGLAVSLAAALLIMLHVRHELSYESFFTDPGRVHRVEVTYQNKGQPAIPLAQSAAPATAALRAEFPGMLTATSLDSAEMVVTAGERVLRTPVTFTDEYLLDVLDFPVAAGDADAALTQPGNAVVSKSMALRLFGTEEAIGRTLRIGRDAEFRVAAILRDLPGNTHFRDLDVLVSRESPVWPGARFSTSWGIPLGFTFIRLKDGVRPGEVGGQLDGMVNRRVPDSLKAMGTPALSLRALPDIHLTAGEGSTISDHNRTMLYALSGTAVLLILIACFNYINLATARAQLRIREVGMRKILGGTARQLVAQFLGETVMTTLLAFLLALALTAATLPVFANLVNRGLSLSSLANFADVGWISGLLLFVSLVAGAYPAFYLASLRPTVLFRNRSTSAGGSLLRQAMVGIQFSFTIALIIAAGVVYSQVSYLRNFDPGFDKEGLLIIQNMPIRADAGRGQAYLDAVMGSPHVSGVAAALAAPGPDYEGNMFFRRAGSASNPLLALQDLQVGYGYFDLLGLAPLAGRVFSPEFDDVADLYARTPSSAASIVISESAVPYYGFDSPRQAVGSVLQGEWMGGQIDYTIIGVVPDIHLRLAQAPNKPADYLLVPDNLRTGMVRVVPGGYQAALNHARETWNHMFPGEPFEYEFLEDVIARANADDARQSGLFAFFTGLAILVACLGLFGLASFVAARRTQEIAIRKVLGASTAGVTGMLLWEFAKPVLAANIVAWPIAWLLMRQWLNGFAYRVELSPVFFLGASAVALLVTVLTIAARTLSVARTRPAMALKHE